MLISGDLAFVGIETPQTVVGGNPYVVSLSLQTGDEKAAQVGEQWGYRCFLDFPILHCQPEDAFIDTGPHLSIVVKVGYGDAGGIGAVLVTDDVFHAAVFLKCQAVDMRHGDKPDFPFTVEQYIHASLGEDFFETFVLAADFCHHHGAHVDDLCIFIEDNPQATEFVFANLPGGMAPPLKSLWGRVKT